MDLSTRPRPRTGRGDLLLAVVGALAFAWASVGAIRAREEAARARSALAAVESETSRGEARLRAIGARGGGEAERLALRVALNAEAPVPQVLADLTRLMPEEVRLRALQVSYGDEVSVEAQVEARSVAAWDAFLDRLATSKRFRGVASGPEAREGELRVTIRMLYGAEAS
jgi:hypothetical protein